MNGRLYINYADLAIDPFLEVLQTAIFQYYKVQVPLLHHLEGWAPAAQAATGCHRMPQDAMGCSNLQAQMAIGNSNRQ